MLSYIFRLAFDFEKKHGYWPNMLYLNTEHFRHWHDEFADAEAFDEISRRLQMEIVISVDALHPHVAWLPNRQHAIAS
jgi:hypothetical protein